MAEADLWQALSDTIQRAVNLRVVTLVGDAVITGTLERMQIGAPAASAGSLVTDINLMAGDITRIISSRLLGAEYNDLRTQHEQAVAQAQAIVERNAKILVAIVREIGQDLGALPAPSTGPVRTNGGG